MNAINRLRVALHNSGVSYENDDSCKIERIKIPSVKNPRISVIQGFGTYGYEDDLLEVWDLNEEEPDGYLTVRETILYILDALF